jgi:ATP-dependent helicase HrpB
VAEIQHVERLLGEGQQTDVKPLVYSLYGDLPYETQRKAILPDVERRRKVILSTPIAETSITIEGVTTVIDSGFARFARFDAASGLERLVTERISRDAAEQRAGRAGRTGPGHCVRLWSSDEQMSLRQSRSPEILQADLCSYVLELAAWGVRDPRTFPMLTPAPESSIAYAREILGRLNAIDTEGAITDRGRSLARLGTHPRIASMFLAAHQHQLLDEACNLAALLEERDIMRWAEERSADVELRLALLSERARDRAVDSGLLERVRKAAQGWRRRLDASHAMGKGVPAGKDVRQSVAGFLLAQAFPERIARRRANATTEEARYVLSMGKGAWLKRGDPLGKDEYLVIAAMKETTGDSPVMLAAPLNPRLFDRELKELTRENELVEWDDATQRVRAVVRRSCGAVTIYEKAIASAEPRLIEDALLHGLRRSGGVSALAWSESCRELQARVRCLRAACPELGIASLENEDLEASLDDWLRPFLGDSRSLSELQSLDLLALLKNILGWQIVRELDASLPESIELPSGKRRHINYLDGALPTLEATVQELFGWAANPKLGRGRVALRFSILSPARRPVQVTQDLAGFWRDSYPEVRKELRGRYPRHKWPENPLE